MDWFEAVDGYCERIGPHFWAEPVNAVTNLAFLIVAAVMWRRAHGLGRGLAVVLGLIGIGSFLFHTFAQPWAGVADVLPILIFILMYLFAANRDFWGMRPRWAFAATLLFFPYAALSAPLFGMIPVLGVSAGYLPVAALIAAYGIALRARDKTLSNGLLIGAAILMLSITLRSLDEPICPRLPLGTHFWWHILNGIMLGWMIEVWRRRSLAGPAGPR